MMRFMGQAAQVYIKWITFAAVGACYKCAPNVGTPRQIGSNIYSNHLL